MNIFKVITPDNLGKGITFNPQTKKWEVNVESGLSCSAIDQLPEKTWKKGTTLLAKQDGQCIRLAALDSIFQEIGVGIAADKTSAFTGETYNVTVTVTNTGESKNELTNLTVQKPLLGNYEILDVRTSKQAVDEVETLDQLNYNLKGLAKGGTFILRFSVKANDVGTFQFSATVNPNSALDQNAKNNTDTIILKANTKIDTTYVPSVDCPRITATELDSNTVLAIASPDRDGIFAEYTCRSDNWNIFANRESLKGLRIRVDGASTAILYGLKQFRGHTSTVVELSNNRLVYAGIFNRTVSAAHNSSQTPIDGLAFRDGVIEITKDMDAAMILFRPAGKNCRWQALYIIGAVEPKRTLLVASDIRNATIRYENNYRKDSNRNETFQFNVIPSSVSYQQKIGESVSHLFKPNNAPVISKLIVTVKSGEAASLTITKEGDNVVIPFSSGKLTVTENRITVAADATSTDSINSEFLQVIVED